MQLIAVAVALGVKVGSAVLVGVRVEVGGRVFTGVIFGKLTEVGMKVAVIAGVTVGTKVAVANPGIGDGVLVSAANPVGREFPTIGMEIRNERALADTTSIGSIGKRVRIGS